MKDFLNKIITWVKANILLSVLLVMVALFFLGGRKLKRMVFGVRRRRKRRISNTGGTRSGRTLPRSVNTRGRGKGYPAVGGGTIPFKYNKDGTVKKAWQVAGTVAAKNRMSRLRKRA